MEFEIRESLDNVDAEAIVVPISEGADPASPCDARFAATASMLFSTGDLPLKPLETMMIPGTPKIVFVGLAKAADAEAWRKLAATAVRRIKARTIAFSKGDARSIVEGALVGGFSVEAYKTTNSKISADRVVLVAADAAALEQGRIAGESMNWARQLINEAPNRKPPRVIADRALAMAASAGLSIEVLDEHRLRELKMGALLGVSQGSDEPPRLIVLRHAGNADSTKTLAFVGKGVTFDTGGISLKPAEGMEKMKYDMAGGATAMAAVRTLALLKAKVNCIAVVPLVENMPGGRAQRPGDVVESLSGKTIEVINTDAEGRLILADALALSLIHI